MKTSWIIFIILVYATIFYFAGVAEYNSLITPSFAANAQALGNLQGTDWLTQGVSEVVAAWDTIKNFIPMIFLWNGTLWVGSWLYFYYFVCLPICGGMGLSLLFILRGVHNS